MGERKPYWISWYDLLPGKWEYHGPWWDSGLRCNDDAATICAAVMASSEEEAKQIILDAHDNPPGDLEWRFVKEDGLEPWGGPDSRFKLAEWMKWPWPLDGVPHREYKKPEEPTKSPIIVYSEIPPLTEDGHCPLKCPFMRPSRYGDTCTKDWAEEDDTLPVVMHPKLGAGCQVQKYPPQISLEVIQKIQEKDNTPDIPEPDDDDLA